MSRVLATGLGLFALALAGCGGTASTRASSSPSVAEAASQRQLTRYVTSVVHVFATRPAPSYSDPLAPARAALHAVEALAPPSVFKPNHERIVHGLAGYLAAGPAWLAARLRKDDGPLFLRLDQHLRAEAAQTRRGSTETEQILTRCQRDHFSC